MEDMLPIGQGSQKSTHKKCSPLCTSKILTVAPKREKAMNQCLMHAPWWVTLMAIPGWRPAQCQSISNSSSSMNWVRFQHFMQHHVSHIVPHGSSIHSELSGPFQECESLHASVSLTWCRPFIIKQVARRHSLAYPVVSTDPNSYCANCTMPCETEIHLWDAEFFPTINA